MNHPYPAAEANTAVPQASEAPLTEKTERTERALILSPNEKAVMEPLMAYLTPERIANVKEIIINTPNEVGMELTTGEWKFEPAPSLDFQRLMEIMKLLAEKTGQAFNVANPIVSLRMPGGHRAQVVAGGQNPNRFSMAIRIHREQEFSLDNYQMTDEDRRAIADAVRSQKTLLISGGTGSGKTSFMNAILKYIPAHERLLTIEDIRELKIPHKNWVAFTFANISTDKNAPGVTDLLNAALRMRPDRILLGEIRKENAFTFCSAINTGHMGSMSTVHANDPDSAIDAVINRVMLNGEIADSAMNVLRRQLINDIYGVVQLERMHDGVRAYFKVLKT